MLSFIQSPLLSPPLLPFMHSYKPTFSLHQLISSFFFLFKLLSLSCFFLSKQHNRRRRKGERPIWAWNSLSFYYYWQCLTAYCTSHGCGYPQQQRTNRRAFLRKRRKKNSEERRSQARVLSWWGNELIRNANKLSQTHTRDVDLTL